MRTLSEPGAVEALAARFARLEPSTPRKWGKMSAAEMLAHVGDACRCVLGEQPASMADTWMSRNVVKWIALHTPMPWPPGVPTRPELDQQLGGTKPGDFERDRAAVVALLIRMASPDASFANHPTFGAMTRAEWMTWGYRHTDHHLRQFGV
jgi:hypothetical protein